MSPPKPDGRLAPTTLDLDIDEICDSFEDAWKGGRTPRLKAYAARLSPDRQGALLQHLLVIELRYRRRRGQQPLLRNFLRRFPAHANRVRAAFDHQEPLRSPKSPPPQADPCDFSFDIDAKPPALPGFEILELIGEGGMGIVYKALHTALNLIVAVKILPPALFASKKRLDYFRREARNMARLIHPCIVRLHNYDALHVPPYLYMEYVEGGSLADKLRAGIPDPQWSAKLLVKLAECLKYMHDKNIIHRDLKPANILLKANGNPKIADFGLGKCLGIDTHITLPYTVLGTPSYMSPEAAAGKVEQITGAADIYGLGAILYDCLAGRPPFFEATNEATRQKVIDCEPLPPSCYKSVPPHLEKICLRCLAKDPAHRYPDGAALAKDLRRYLADKAPVPREAREEDWHPRWAKNAGYEILELVGCSFAGMVYKARQLEPLNRIVTLMTLSTPAAHDPARTSRFKAAAEAAAQLQHPNIVPIFGYDVHAGQPHFSMEYLSGGTLASRTGQPWPMREAVEMIRTLAAAAGFAHLRNIVHGDLRPFNVLLSSDGTPKITGFGLGSVVDKNPDFRPGLRIGLSNYMAPERAAGRCDEIGPATDVHALGAMLYELLTGRPPFFGNDIDETIHQVLNFNPPAPSQLRPGLLSPALDSVCLRCLNKNPADRFAHGQALADMLGGLLADDRQQTGEFQFIPGYEMLEPLAHEGLGTIYKARQVSLDRLVVLKLFEKDGRRFLRSHQAVARIAHPNLVQIIDCGQREQISYVVEEFVEGTDLQQFMARGPQPLVQVAALVETIARALHHVHQHQVVHRDLKPRKIRLSPLGIPKITGFDLALRLDERAPEAETAGLVGTPRYMAPEQLDAGGDAITPATDVFAVGLILYEMLTGSSRFRQGEVLQVIDQIRNRSIDPPSAHVAAIDPRLDQICLKCLEKAPNSRTPSAGVLAEELRLWREDFQRV